MDGYHYYVDLMNISNSDSIESIHMDKALNIFVGYIMQYIKCIDVEANDTSGKFVYFSFPISALRCLFRILGI